MRPAARPPPEDFCDWCAAPVRFASCAKATYRAQSVGIDTAHLACKACYVSVKRFCALGFEAHAAVKDYVDLIRVFTGLGEYRGLGPGVRHGP